MNAEYWNGWEKLGYFDDREWTCEVLRDHGGKIHMIQKWHTIDGKIIPDEHGTPRAYFEHLDIPYDKSRVGEMVCDRVMTLKKAIKIWTYFTTPTDLQKFLNKMI